MTNHSTNIPVFDACGEIVSMILPQIHRHDVLQNIVPEAIDRAVSENPHQRRFAARIIGSLNDALDATELEAIFIKTALNLSMDEDDTVRALIAQSMASMGIKLPLRVSEKMLWPRLSDMIRDDNCQVKAAAMRAMARSAESHRRTCLTSPSFDALVKPVFLNECQRAAEIAASDLRVVNDDTYLLLEIFSEVYGYFLCALSPLFDNQKLWKTVLSSLRLMVTCNGPTVRHWCSFNMPAIASLCSDEKSEHVSGIIEALAGDSDLETRATLAAGIHEVTKSLRHSALRSDVIRAVGMLFMDENAQVRMNALGHFSELLQLLSANNKNSSAAVAHTRKGQIQVSDDITIRLGADVLARDGTDDDEMRRLAPMFSSLELMSFDSWRTQRLLAEEVEKSAHLIPQEMLCEHVAPLLFQMARESTFLVRKASMRSLIHVLRYVPDVRRRNHILKHFKMEWAHGKVYWTRLAFVEASECGLKLFSLKLFTSLFKDEVLGLKDDKVVNVRIRLLRFLRDMVSVWKDLIEYRAAIDQLTSDEDWQVSAEAKELMQSLDTMEGQGLEDIALDRQKESAEDAFFVHTNYKKRKGKGKGKRTTSDGLIQAEGIGAVESLVSNDVAMGTAVTGDGMAGGKVHKRPSSHGMGSGGASKNNNNSALAEDSPTKNGSATLPAGRRRTGRDDKTGNVEEVRGAVAGGVEAAKGTNSTRADNSKNEPGGGKKSIWNLLCGCFSRG